MSGGGPHEVLLGEMLERAGVGVAVIGGDYRYRYVNSWIGEINGVSPEEHVGRAIDDIVPNIAERLRGLIDDVLAAGEVLTTVVGGSTAVLADRQWQASYVPVESSDDPAVAAVVIDVTDRMAAEQESRRRVRQNLVVAEISRRALRNDDVEDVLIRACDGVRAELGADRAGVLLLEPGQREQLVMRAESGFPPGLVGRLISEARTGSMAGYTLMADGPVITPDTDDEQRFTFDPALRALGVRSAISAPIPGELGPVGVLGVLSGETEHFIETDSGFVRAVAHAVGAALQNDGQRRRLEELAVQRGRLVAQALEAGEREQRRVADVLHDDVLQHLLFALQELAGDDDAAAARARASVERATELLRAVAASMHPVTLSHAGLAVAVGRVASEHADRGNLEIDVDIDPDAEGFEDQLLISLVRELLNNVVKHASATCATVTVCVAEGHRVELDVIDDGHGISPDAVADAGRRGNLGLAYGRERVEALGGAMEIRSGPDGRGTAVSIVLPLRQTTSVPTA